MYMYVALECLLRLGVSMWVLSELQENTDNTRDLK